jgi:hemoglobin/transferrin/lactoferrin receptor protein
MRTIKFAFFIFITVISFSNALFAQNTDTLYLRDLTDLSPIPYVQVQILNSKGQAVNDIPYSSNEEGIVVLQNFDSEQYLLIQDFNYHQVYLNWYELKATNGRIFMKARALDLVEVVVLGSSKFEEKEKEVPSQITLIDKKQIQLYNPQTSATALENSGDVFVQRSQMGGGSPIIRGFEANKVLIVLDGIRMNNAIYRAGHLQNVITIDNAILERIEVHHGPASTIYGSDALGGVMYFSTKKPKLQQSASSSPFALNAYTRFSTANFERSAHLDFNLGNKKFASLSSITYSNFDDLRAGRVKSDTSMARYWNRYFYVERNDTMDVVRINENPNVQVGTAYAQMDILQKFRYRPHKAVDLLFNIQYSTSSNVPRYDRLTEGEVGFYNGQIISQQLEYAEWYYGPQERLLTSLHARFTPDSFALFNSANVIAAFQRISEDRITRKFLDPLRRIQAEDLGVFTFNADFVRRFSKKMNLLYGVEGTHNIVSSRAETINIETGELSTRGLGTRYPDGGSTMSTASAYANYRLKIGKRANVIAGGRYTYTHIGANYVDSVLYDLPYERIDVSTNALTGSLSLAWDMGHQFQFNGVVATAFRTPNIDDMAKIRAKGGNVTVPNPDIQPEKALNTEVSISKQFNQKVKLSGTFFHTYLYDAVVQQDYSINGTDTMYYDGRFRNIQALVNIGQARVWGLHGGMAVEFNEAAFLKASVTYTRGRDYSGAEPQPLGHIPPLFGQLSFNYSRRLFSVNFLTRFNGPKTLEEYSDDSSENLDKALPSGTPAWFIFNIYTSYKINKQFKLNVGVENLLDWHYRPYSSGVSAPGQNVIISLQGSF